MKIREQAALALDNSLDAAANKRGIYTEKARDTLASYLDGAIKLRVQTVRAYVRYLKMVR